MCLPSGLVNTVHHRMQAISALRQKASHATGDVGIVDSDGGVHAANTGQYSIAQGRSPAQVQSP